MSSNQKLVETSLLPHESVEVWSSFVDPSGTLFYALLNRSRNYAVEVWRRTPDARVFFVWRSPSEFKASGVSISPLGRSVAVVWSHAATPDSSTAFLPVMTIIPDVLETEDSGVHQPPIQVKINVFEDTTAREASQKALTQSGRALSWLRALDIREGQSLRDWMDDWLWSNPPKLVDWVFATLRGYGLL